MATKVAAVATKDASGVLKKMEIERRAPREHDVRISIKFCGICHSDLHQIKNEWGGSTFPMVPGHEIVGIVDAVGSAVTKFKVGDKVGVGCFVDSCRTCPNCRLGDEQYCLGDGKGGACQFTYNFVKPDGEITFGGYSEAIVVDEQYVLRIPDNLDLAGAAPLLCAGITVFSPFVTYGVRSHHTVGVVGLGGLGHMAVKILNSMGCDVVVFSTSPSKEAEARALGAHHFIITTKPEGNPDWANKLDFIIDTVSAKHDLQPYFAYLKTNASYCVVGVPPEPYAVHAGDLIFKRIKFGGSLIGGISQTQDMLDFCGRHNITATIELIPASYANKAMQRLVKNDVHFRFVIDIANSLSASSPEVEDA